MDNTEFKVNPAEFMTAIKRVKHCMSDNEARRNLMGVNLSVSETDLTRLNVLAADSFRIARQSIEITTDKPFNITVDHYPVKDRCIEKYLKQYLNSEIPLTGKIRPSEEQMYLIPDNGSDCLAVKLKSEEYRTEIMGGLLKSSESSTNRIVIEDVNSFYRAAEYIYYASDSCRQAVIKLNLSKTGKDGYNDYKTVSLEMGINADNVHFREASFNIVAEGSNTVTHIGLNVSFLKDALKVFKTLKAKRLTLSYEHSERPCFLMADVWDARLTAGHTFQQIILPVKLRY